MHNHRCIGTFEEHAHRSVALYRKPLGKKFLDNGAKHVMVKALAVPMIKLNVQPSIDGIDLFAAVGEELVPELQVAFFASVQSGRLGQYLLVDLRMLL